MWAIVGVLGVIAVVLLAMLGSLSMLVAELRHMRVAHDAELGEATRLRVQMQTAGDVVAQFAKAIEKLSSSSQELLVSVHRLEQQTIRAIRDVSHQTH